MFLLPSVHFPGYTWFKQTFVFTLPVFNELHNCVLVEHLKGKTELEVPIGQMMYLCSLTGDPMPTVVEESETDDEIPKRIKRIISYMCKFKYTDRKHISEVHSEMKGKRDMFYTIQ